MSKSENISPDELTDSGPGTTEKELSGSRHESAAARAEKKKKKADFAARQKEDQEKKNEKEKARKESARAARSVVFRSSWKNHIIMKGSKPIRFSSWQYETSNASEIAFLDNQPFVRRLETILDDEEKELQEKLKENKQKREML